MSKKNFISKYLDFSRVHPYVSATFLIGILAVTAFPNAALAANKINCNPVYRQNVINAAIEQAKQDSLTNEAIRRAITNPPPNKLLSCVGSYWPSLSLSFPTMDQLTKAAEDYVIQTACTEARSQLSKVTNPIMSAAGSWGNIPGFNGAPSTGGGVGFGGTGGVTVNGQPTGDWTDNGLNGLL